MNKKRTNWVALCVVTVTSVMLLGAFAGSTSAGQKNLKSGNNNALIRAYQLCWRWFDEGR